MSGITPQPKSNESQDTEWSKPHPLKTAQCCDPTIDGLISSLLDQNTKLRSALVIAHSAFEIIASRVTYTSRDPVDLLLAEITSMRMFASHCRKIVSSVASNKDSEKS